MKLAHVYWIGGSPCSGKSSIVDMLAEQYGMNALHADDFFEYHVHLADPDRQPDLHKLQHMSWDALFSRPVPIQIADEIEIYRQEFPLLLEDLLALPREIPVVVEGAALLPELVAPLLPAPEQAIYVIPTSDFQRTTYATREWRHFILNECRDPEQAWQNWMDRDVGFGQWVATEAQEQGLRVLEVDGEKSIAENAALIARHFQLEAQERRPTGASVIVYRQGEDGPEFLLLHRAVHGPDYEGDWAWTPPSGVREHGETAMACAIRELQEEVGLALSLRPAGAENGTWAVFLTEMAPDAEIHLDPEHDRYEWLPRAAALERVRPAMVADALQLAVNKLG